MFPEGGVARQAAPDMSDTEGPRRFISFSAQKVRMACRGSRKEGTAGPALGEGPAGRFGGGGNGFRWRKRLRKGAGYKVPACGQRQCFWRGQQDEGFNRQILGFILRDWGDQQSDLCPREITLEASAQDEQEGGRERGQVRTGAGGHAAIRAATCEGVLNQVRGGEDGGRG